MDLTRAWEGDNIEQDKANIITHYQISEEQLNAIQEKGLSNDWITAKELDTPPTPTPTQPKPARPAIRKVIRKRKSTSTLGVSYYQIMKKLDKFFTLRSGRPIDGLPNYIGNYGGTVLQIIGHKQDVSSVTIVIVASLDDLDNITSVTMAHLFLLNIFPRWTDNLTWLGEVAQMLVAKPSGRKVIVKDNKIVEASTSNELGFGMITITVKPK